jgi:hypothetical protein
VLDELRRAAGDEASRGALHQPERPIRGAQQQHPGVRGHLAAIEGSHHLAAFDHFPAGIGSTVAAAAIVNHP